MSEHADDPERSGLSRRALLARAGMAAATLGAGAIADACGDETGTPVGPDQLSTDTSAHAFPPLPPMNMPMPGVHGFFSKHEARTVDALVSRLLPGSKEDPGAHELGVVTFIDHKLAQFQSFATPTYFKPPFAKKTTANAGPQPHAGDTIEVNAKQLPRYGFQSKLTPQQAYRGGLAALDSYTLGRYGKQFLALGDAVKDATITDLEANKVPSMVDPAGNEFFAMLQEDLCEGAFSDPMYGGNRNLGGWALVGYPGAQRAYTEHELKSGPLHKRLQGLRQMMSQNPGEPQGHASLPISGTEITKMGG
jgi:gluconate 2-dehydrogenase gamma chain